MLSILLLTISVISACNLRPGPICSQDRTVFADECALNASGKKYSYALNNNAVCAEGRIWYKNECKLINDGKVRNPDLQIYNRTCLACNVDSGKVCSTLGAPFSNMCELKYYGHTVSTLLKVFDGSCLEAAPAACNSTSGPVCSSDHVVYANECLIPASSRLSYAVVSPPLSGSCQYCDINSGPVCSASIYNVSLGTQYQNHCDLVRDSQKIGKPGYCIQDILKLVGAYKYYMKGGVDGAEERMWKAYSDCVLGCENSDLRICKLEYYRYCDAFEAYMNLKDFSLMGYTSVKFLP